MFNLFNRSAKGFTLIELLVVIAIIGILSSVVLVSLNGARAKGRDAKRVTELQQMARAIQIADRDPAADLDCDGAYDPAHTCVDPVNLSQFSDPSVGQSTTDVCGPGDTDVCQYSVSSQSGGAAADTQDWQICGFLESGAAGVNAGLVSISSASSTPHAGCN